MKLYLIRHGETDFNKRRLLQGRTDTKLNDYGRELAKKTAEGLLDVPFDLAFTSPLKRAKETAQIVLGDRKIPLVDEPRIQEISFGEFEGLCIEKERYNIPDETFMNFFNQPEAYNTPPGGESFASVLERTGDFLSGLLEREEYADKTILVSTHGCALKALLANIRNTPLPEFWGGGVNKNCAVTILEAEGKSFKILKEGIVFY